MTMKCQKNHVKGSFEIKVDKILCCDHPVANIMILYLPTFVPVLLFYVLNVAGFTVVFYDRFVCFLCDVNSASQDLLCLCI